MNQLKCIRDGVDRKEIVPLYEYVEYKDIDADGKEVTKKRKSLYIKGIFLEGDIKNKNGRIYPVPMLDKAIVKFMKEKVRGVGVPGELNHPQSSIQIDLDRVSHYITDLYLDGNKGIGKAKISSTPTGKIAEALINDGMILGVSTRGVGSLDQDEEGRNIVSDFDLITVDIVSDPSAPNAFVESIMEGLNYYIDSDTKDIKMATTVEQLLESLKNNLKILPKKSDNRNELIYANIKNILSKI
jgi:hypothetical protein